MTTSKELRFEVSTVCNYQCRLCPRPKMTRPKTLMTTELFAQLFCKAQAETGGQFTHLTFSGMGEPLFDKDLESKVEIAKRAGLKTFLVTNGFLLNLERFQALQAAGLDMVRVSFHATNPKDYAICHGVERHHYLETSWHLHRILQLKGLTKVAVYYVLQDPSKIQIKKVKQMWADADLLEIWRPHNWAYAFSFREVSENFKLCRRAENGPLQIQVDGTINACCFDYDGLTKMGDLKEESLKQIFERSFNKGACVSCDQQNADKSEALIYTSKKISDRIERTSTAFQKI